MQSFGAAAKLQDENSLSLTHWQPMRFGQPHIAFIRPPWHTVEQHRVGLALLHRMSRNGAHGTCCLAEYPVIPRAASNPRTERRDLRWPTTMERPSKRN